jgi:5-methylcytosine-specific restriction protein B
MSQGDSGSVRFTVSGRHFSLSRDQVEKALAGIKPEQTKRHAVQIGRDIFPVKQALSQVTGLDRLDFQSMDARRVFRRLGFKLLRAAE